MPRIRLLPVVIVAAVVLFGVKAERLWRAWPEFSISEAAAKSSEKAEETGAKQPKAEMPKQAAMAKQDVAADGKEASTAGKNEGDAKADGGGDAPAMVKLQPGKISPAELEVLQSLAERREALERRSGELRLQENVLAATEKRIDEKIEKLKGLEAQIKKLLKQYDKEKEEKLKSLVKVYETMKPKDAAKIFEQLEMEILLDVTERMKETKMAPVLAAMDPEKAKQLTVELATRRTLPQTGSDGG